MHGLFESSNPVARRMLVVPDEIAGTIDRVVRVLVVVLLRPIELGDDDATLEDTGVPEDLVDLDVRVIATIVERVEAAGATLEGIEVFVAVPGIVIS